MPQTAHTRIVQPAELQEAPAPPAARNSFPVPGNTIPPPGPASSGLPRFPQGGNTVSSFNNPQAAAAMAGAAMASAQPDFPDKPPGIYDSFVRLPGGLHLGGDDYIWTAEIRELNGGHEEQMARAAQSGNNYHFLETLLACGTARLGSKDPAETAALLPRLLTGDRDMLGLAIRCVTYGEEFEYFDFVCPLCGGYTAKITCSLLPKPDGDIELRTLAHPRDAAFDVPLRHGGTASVRLPDGNDQKYLAEFMNTTPTERNSALLRRCVTKVTEPSGIVRDVAAEPSVILAMSAGDRRTLIKSVTDRQPGPQLLAGVKFQHLDCGKEVSLPVTLGALFL